MSNPYLKWWFHEDHPYEHKCVICHTKNGIEWCGTCKEYLCPPCSNNWPARIQSAKDRAVKHFKERFV
jgi:cytochrome c